MLDQITKSFEETSREAGMLAVLCRQVKDNKISPEEFGKKFTEHYDSMFAHVESANTQLNAVFELRKTPTP